MVLTPLVAEPPASHDVMDLAEFYEHIEKRRVEATETLVKKYRTITPLLGKARLNRDCPFPQP